MAEHVRSGNVVRDAVDPGAQGAAAVKSFETAPHGDVDVLQKIALGLGIGIRTAKGFAKVAATSTLLPHLGSVSHLYAIEDRSQADYLIGSMKQRILSKELASEESHGYLARVDNQGEFRLFRTMYRGFVPPPKKRRSIHSVSGAAT